MGDRLLSVLAALWAVIMLVVVPAAGQNRLALVVGNDAYQHIDPLKKAVNDARAMAQALERLGFTVTLGENLVRREFVRTIAAFENRIKPGAVAFVFYSGHGVEIDGANYLVPVDVPRVSAGQQGVLKDEVISTDSLIQRLKAHGTLAQVVVLDACRDNPFRDATGRSIGGPRGLTRTQPTNGIFVLYSAGIGETALDRLSDSDTHPNSVFTRSFLPLLADPARSMVEVAKETRARVKALAGTIGHQQSPAYYDEVDGDLFLAQLGGAPPRQPSPASGPMATPTQPPAPEPTPPMVRLDPAAPPAPAAHDFIFPDSDRRYLKREELTRLTRDQLRLARNEIYARRGRFFQDANLTAYFSRFPWYRPHTWDPPLTPIEQANIGLIQAMER